MENVKVLLLNLPYKKKIVRRWMCSYNVVNFLLLPYELLSCASVLSKNENVKVFFKDAISENMNLEECINYINKVEPDILFSITGFEMFGDDVKTLKRLRKEFPEIKIGVMGYYPSIFPEKFLKITALDFIVRFEPEFILEEYCLNYNNRRKIGKIKGLVYISETDGIVVNEDIGRIENLESIPPLDRSFIDNTKYSEPFMPEPFTEIETSRGCPYNCNYCLKTYGDKVYYRNPENVINEIKSFIKDYGIKSFRIMDDIFTSDKNRMIDFCRKLIDNDIKIVWSCLSRIDVIDEERLEWLKRSGCRRLYIGIESGSQHVLDKLDKNYKVDEIEKKFRLIKKYRLETAVFFMVGMPFETDDDFMQSVELAKKLNPDFIMICKFIPYPLTIAFDELHGEIDFNLYPYRNRFKKYKYERVSEIREKLFFRLYFFRFKQFLSKFILMLKSPKSVIKVTSVLLKYISNDKNKDMKEDFI